MLSSSYLLSFPPLFSRHRSIIFSMRYVSYLAPQKKGGSAMKKVLISMMIVGLLLLPSMVFGQPDQMSTGVPPVAQPLIREGDFAVKLVDILKIGTAKDEAEAETMLSSSGIAPKNGWIADYPVTPDIIGELQSAVGDAADSKKLPMGKDEALKAFQDLTASLSLSIVADTSGSYIGSEPSISYGDYLDPTVINNYYYDEGPPVVSYYPPPWDYYYMYAWVPYPFWWGGFHFRGFFCLRDFHRRIFVGSRHAWVTNHFTDPVNRKVFRVNPDGRRTGETFRTADISGRRGFNTSEARRGAASIFERSNTRVSSFNGGTPTMGNSAAGSRSSFGRQNGANFQGPSAREGRSFSGPNRTNERSFSSPSMSGRNFNRSESSGRSFSAPSRGSERSFNSPSTVNRSFRSSESSGRTFSGPSRSFSGSSSRGSSFSCQNCHGGSSSFGRSGGGSSSTSFSGGNLSGGHGGGGGFSGGRGGGGGRGR